MLMLSSVLMNMGCEKDLVFAPVTSVRVISSQQRRELAPSQVNDLAAWLKSHRKGWQSSPASYLPSDRLAITHQDGHTSEINLLGSGLIVVNIPSGQFVKQVSPAEISQLRTIAGF